MYLSNLLLLSGSELRTPKRRPNMVAPNPPDIVERPPQFVDFRNRGVGTGWAPSRCPRRSGTCQQKTSSKSQPRIQPILQWPGTSVPSQRTIGCIRKPILAAKCKRDLEVLFGARCFCWRPGVPRPNKRLCLETCVACWPWYPRPPKTHLVKKHISGSLWKFNS